WRRLAQIDCRRAHIADRELPTTGRTLRRLELLLVKDMIAIGARTHGICLGLPPAAVKEHESRSLPTSQQPRSARKGLRSDAGECHLNVRLLRKICSIRARIDGTSGRV